jgi:hypothetical protein
MFRLLCADMAEKGAPGGMRRFVKDTIFRWLCGGICWGYQSDAVVTGKAG